MHDLGNNGLFLFNLNFIVMQVKAQTTAKKTDIKPKKDTKKKLVKRSKLKKRSATIPSKKDDGVPDELRWMQEDPQDQLLSRFVETPKGTRVGESIGIEKKRMILKFKSNFYVIPINYVKEKDDKLVLLRKVNWDRAGKLGEIWRKNALDPLYISQKKQKQQQKASQKKPRKKPRKAQPKKQQVKRRATSKGGQPARTKPPKPVKKVAKTLPKKTVKKGAN
jgi:hypothetical protein